MSSLRGRNQQTIFDNSVSTCLGWRRSSDSTAANLTTKSVSPHMASTMGRKKTYPHLASSRLVDIFIHGCSTQRTTVHSDIMCMTRPTGAIRNFLSKRCESYEIASPPWKNDLAQELRRFSQLPNMEDLIVTTSRLHAAHRASRLRVARARHIRVHFGGNNAE